MPSTPGAQTAPSLTPRRASKMASNQALNLNHLLNFTLPPRQTHSTQALPRRSKKPTHQAVWNKERFVNAQYRFVMNPHGDYTVHFADPDIFFQWQDILQVIIPRSSALASAGSNNEAQGAAEGHTTCPICLAPPSAPRMTKCGHVFCFPCILHYLSPHDKGWARCPICFDSVHEKQLKSVKWFDGPIHVEEEVDAPVAGSSSSGSVDAGFEASPRPGTTMRLRLIQRPQITTMALPRSHTWPSDLLPPHQAPFHFLPDVFDYAKFMLATPSYLVTDLTRDLDELASERRLLSSMSDPLGVVFVDAAEEKVRHQMTKAAELHTAFLQEKIDRAARDLREIEDRVVSQRNRRKQEAAAPQSEAAPHEFLALTSDSVVGRGNRPRRNVNPPPPSTSTYYYYQAASGLPVFLHPLDIKILLSHFGGYSSFPDLITVQIEAASEGTVNDDLRKRCKYLAHMPEGADVVFVEANLHGVVGESGLKSFENALKLRAGRRKEKGKKDDRARARAEERERDKVLATTATTWTFASQAVAPVRDEVVVAPQESQQPSGVWGARTFAAAAHSSSSASQPLAAARAPSAGPRWREEDDWEMDAAWDDLESRVTSGKKRGNKLVVLGGGGAGRRRR